MKRKRKCVEVLSIPVVYATKLGNGHYARSTSRTLLTGRAQLEHFNDNTRWKFTFQYHRDGLNILLNEKFYHKYKWNIQDGGYNTISYIQIEFLQDKHHRQGVKWADPESSEPARSGTHGCTLLALMPPRTPLGAAAFDEP